MLTFARVHYIIYAFFILQHLKDDAFLTFCSSDFLQHP